MIRFSGPFQYTWSRLLLCRSCFYCRRRRCATPDLQISKLRRRLTSLLLVQATDVLTWHYVFCMGMYRAFYLLNWVWRFMTQVSPNKRAGVKALLFGGTEAIFLTDWLRTPRRDTATGLCGFLVSFRPCCTWTFSNITSSGASLLSQCA